MIDGVICVGAVEWTDPDGNGPLPGFWENAHFNGDRVDIWAPITSLYYHPPTIDAVEPNPDLHVEDDFGGTSAAAPYITGLIANLMAIDPTLNPSNAGLTPEQRSAIPGRVRALLVDTATVLPTGETLVAPLPLMRAAMGDVLPVFAKPYDDSINFSETDAANSYDLPHTAFNLNTLSDAAHPVEQTGTILTIPGTDPGGLTYTDADWFEFQIPVTDAHWLEGLYQTTVLLYTPAASAFGALAIDGDGFSTGNRAFQPPSANETVREYVAPLLFNGASRRFRVRDDGAGSDNVYSARVFTAWLAPPPEGDRFDRDDDNNRPESRPDNNSPSRAVDLGRDNDEFAWQVVEGPDARYPEAASIVIRDLSFHNTADQDCFQIVHLPPYEFYHAVGCRPRLQVAWEAELQLEILSPDTEEVLMRFGRSPAEIPFDYIFEGVILRLQPGNPGEYITYTLTLTFLPPPPNICSVDRNFPGGSGGGGRPGGADGGGSFFFPNYRPLVTDPTELARFRRGIVEQYRTLDAEGRVTTPDLYLVDWRGSGAFRVAAALETGDSIRLRLFNMEAVELGSASFPETVPPASVSLRALPSNQDQLGRPFVLLELPTLAQGPYVLALSHGRPGTQLELFLPAGATANGAATAEEFLRSYLPIATDYEAGPLPENPIALGLLAIRNGAATFGFLAETGVRYRVEVTESLTRPGWQTLQFLEGQGRAVTISDLPGARQRFYRVRLE